MAAWTSAVPGPLFTFSAYLGAVSKPAPNGWLGALIALVAIFLPSFFFVMGILPFWNRLRTIEAFQAALRGINAAVVGILLAALYQPIWTSAIHAPVDFALGLLAFGLLVQVQESSCTMRKKAYLLKTSVMSLGLTPGMSRLVKR